MHQINTKFGRTLSLIVIAGLLIFLIDAPWKVSAQQQQSGGGGGGAQNITQIGGVSLSLGSKTSANSIPVVVASDQGAQAVSESGTWTVQPGNTPNTTAWKVDGSAVTQPVSGTVALGAATASIGEVTDHTTCSTTVISPAWAAVPTVSTAVTATTTCVEAIIFTNTNASAQTVTVTDGQGSPVTVINAYSIPPNSQVTFPFYGTPMTTGIKWSAGGTGVTGSVKGYQ
jgi:hypothetical protein